MTKQRKEPEKRPYELGKRLEQMDASRAAILRAAKAQLAEQGYRKMTMAGLAAESGVTRQTIHNLFGTKTAVLEAVFVPKRLWIVCRVTPLSAASPAIVILR